jgi:hypothetical protein
MKPIAWKKSMEVIQFALVTSCRKESTSRMKRPRGVYLSAIEQLMLCCTLLSIRARYARLYGVHASAPGDGSVCALSSRIAAINSDGVGASVATGADVAAGTASICGTQAVGKTIAINRIVKGFFANIVIFLIGIADFEYALFCIKHKRFNHRLNCFHAFIPLSATTRVDSNRDIPIGSIFTQIQEVVALGIAVVRAPENGFTERRSSNEGWKSRLAVTERTGMGPIFAHPYIDHIAI